MSPHVSSADVFRVGVGAGFAGDRFEAADLLARDGELDALVFECLAERTIAQAQERRSSGTGPGFDPLLSSRLQHTMRPVLDRGGVIVTNAGAADPVGAANVTRQQAQDLGLDGARIAAVTGDDVLAQLRLEECPVLGTADTLARYADRIISANAYLGADPLIAALAAEAQVVIVGRCADAALFLAPLAHHFGWREPQERANGILVGHLLECAGQLTGGYFADGEHKQVPNLAHLGFPYADVTRDGSAVYAKLAGTGGRLDRMTVLEQLLYEIDDPAAYLTPDVAVDLREVMITELGVDRVGVVGAKAVGVPAQLKVSVGIRDGFIASGEVFYSGPGALRRARLAADIVAERWRDVHAQDTPLQFSYIGVNATTPWTDIATAIDVPEVGLRISTRTLDETTAAALCREVEALYTNGPAGGGGATAAYRRTIGLVSTMVPRSLVQPEVVFV